MIDHDMFDETMIEEINGLTRRGWKIIRILDPMKWLNSDGMFIRIFYEREQNVEQSGSNCNKHDVSNNEVAVCDNCIKLQQRIDELEGQLYSLENGTP